MWCGSFDSWATLAPGWVYVCECMCRCMHVHCMLVNACVYASMFAWIHMCMCAWMYVCISACLYECMFAWHMNCSEPSFRPKPAPLYPDRDNKYKNWTFEPRISKKNIFIINYFRKYWNLEIHMHHMERRRSRGLNEKIMIF